MCPKRSSYPVYPGRSWYTACPGGSSSTYSSQNLSWVEVGKEKGPATPGEKTEVALAPLFRESKLSLRFLISNSKCPLQSRFLAPASSREHWGPSLGNDAPALGPGSPQEPSLRHSGSASCRSMALRTFYATSSSPSRRRCTSFMILSWFFLCPAPKTHRRTALSPAS